MLNKEQYRVTIFKSRMLLKEFKCAIPETKRYTEILNLDRLADLSAENIMLVIVFLGLLAVPLSLDAEASKSLYDIVDKNKDGVARLSEMFDAYNFFDSNKDGLMTFEEFAAGPHPGSPPLSIEEAFEFYLSRDNEKNDNVIDSGGVVTLFDGLDGNKNGKITRQEMKDNYLPLFLGNQDGDSKEQA